MKKLSVTFLFLIAFGTACFAQKLPDFGLNRQRLALSDRTLLIETLPEEAAPKAGREQTYFWYSANQVHATQGGFSGKLLHGLYREFYLNKNLRKEGHFKKGLMDGTWKNWKEDGTLTDSYQWSQGRRSGDYFLYDSLGRLSEAGHYRKDLKEGKVSLYKGQDSVAALLNYHNGKQVPFKAPVWKRFKFFQKKKKPSPAPIIP